MFGFFVCRLGAGLLTLLVIAILSFTLTRMAPGSPFSSEKALHPETITAFDKHFGLNDTLYLQFWRAMKGYVVGDFGPSLYYRGQSCNDYVWPGFQKSILLGPIAAVIAMAVGIPLGVLAAAKHNKLPDYVAMSISIVGICVPNFLLAPLLVMIFAVNLKWLPTALWPETFSGAELTKLIMPAIALSFVHIAYISRLARAGMLDVMNKDFIRTARAKGLDERAVVLRHGLKNGITPVVSYTGPMIAYMVTGSLVVEQIFALPGLGRIFVTAATNRDMNMIMAGVLVFSTLVILMNILVDLVYGFLDPRVRVA